MISIKNYLLSLGTCFGLLLIFSFFINVLNYFDILNNGTYKVLLTLSSILSIAIGSYILGTKTDNKGYLNGFLFGLITIALFLIFSILIKNNLSTSSIIYYLIITITSLISGAIGINKKTTDTNQ